MPVGTPQNMKMAPNKQGSTGDSKLSPHSGDLGQCMLWWQYCVANESRVDNIWHSQMAHYG